MDTHIDTASISFYHLPIMRSFCAIIVAIALLGCPIRCLTGSTMEMNGDLVATCHCCHQPAGNDAPLSSPEDNSKDGDCQSCPCHGAVKSDDSDSVAHVLCVGVMQFAMTPLMTSFQEFRVEETRSTIDHRFRVAGRSLRIAQHSFLC